MSLILDALNRAERERAGPGATTVPDSSALLADGRRQRRWLALLGLALCLSLLVIGWLLWRGDAASAGVSAARQTGSEGTAPQVVRAQPLPPTVVPSGSKPSPGAPQAAGAEAAAVAPAETVPERVAATGAIRSATSAEAVADLYRQPAASPLPAPAPGSGATPVAAAAAASDRATASRAAKDGESEGPAVTADDPAVAELLRRAQSELGRAPLPNHPAPLLAELSQQQKNSIPSLMYLRHDYAESPGASSVLINRTTLREGDAVDGVRVEEIHADFVVLNYRGLRFRLRALNSWVNL